MSTMLREILLFCIAAYPLICGSSFPSARDLMTAKERAHNAASLIFNRFELQYLPNQQLFMSLFNIPPRTWNLLKYKMINKIIGGHANFTIVYGGTAVTAGYDNYLHQSYPMVFQRRVKPIFEAVGVNLDVRNFGQSHVDCRLLNFCTANALAHQADVVGWENSFDCGNAKDAHETIARIAGWRGAVVMYMVSGSFPLENCPPSTDKVPYISEEWSPEKVGIDYRYEPTALDVQDFRDLHVLWHSQGSSGARFTASLEGKYEGVAPHGFSLWTQSELECATSTTLYSGTTGLQPAGSRVFFTALEQAQAQSQSDQRRTESAAGTGTLQPCAAAKLKGPCHAQGGPHWRTREAGLFGNSQKTGRKWHGSAGMHLLRGEVLAFTYLHILMDAIYTIEAVMEQAQAASKAGGPGFVKESPVISRGTRGKHQEGSTAASGGLAWLWGKLTGTGAAQEATRPKDPSVDTIHASAHRAFLEEVETRLATLQSPIPETPLHCVNEECSRVPQCFTNYQPHFALSPQRQDLDRILVGEHLGWYVEAAPGNDLNPELGLLDKKFYYRSEGAKNEIHFQLRDVRSAVRVYARSKKESLEECVFLLDTHVEVTPPVSQYRPSRGDGVGKRIALAPFLNRERSTAEVVHFSGLPAGNHVLTVMSPPVNPFATVTISHIIVF